jgi:hypothetical protein
MRLLRTAAAVAALAVTAVAPVRTAAAQPTVINFDSVPSATAAGAFATASGYAFTNFSTLETNSAFGTGNNGVGARFAYVPLELGFGSVRRETINFDLFGALLSFRAFDGNAAGPVALTVNAYRGFDAAADPVFTRSVLLTNSAQLVTFDWFNVSEVEFLTAPLEGNGRRAVLAIDDLAVATVPEPATVVLVGAGAVLVAAVGARRRRATSGTV